MLLEIATTLGAIAGTAIATITTTGTLSVIFGVVLLVSAWLASRPKKDIVPTRMRERIADRLRLHGTFPGDSGPEDYTVCHVPSGFGLMFGADIISGLLGIGSGAFKVLAMDQVMRIPFKVSTATSNFMIGVTAAASAGVYWHRGYIEPELTMPVMIGVLAGSFVGARRLAGVTVRTLRVVFAIVIAILALEMIYGGLTGRI